MPATMMGHRPSLATFLKSLKQNDIETSIELFVSQLKRRQIRNSRPCALATAHLLLRVVAVERIRDPQALIKRIQNVGRRLVAAQPREMAVGNIVRRILGIVREVAEVDQDPEATGYGLPNPMIPGESLQRPTLPTNISGFSPLKQAGFMPGSPQMQQRDGPSGGASPSPSGTLDSASSRPPMPGSISSYSSQAPQVTSLFGIFQHPQAGSPAPASPIGSQSPLPGTTKGGFSSSGAKEKIDIKAEVIDGIKELLDELDVVDSQIAESALDHIHSNEVILVHTSSQTVQTFLVTAARKRRFTVVHAEAYPNNHLATHATILNGSRKGSGGDEDADERWKPLTEMGITVILIPDSAVFALMSRINKVILAPHTVLANGSLIAAAGASIIAQAAKVHHVPVVVLSGVYKLSPVYPFDAEEMIEYGDPARVIPYQDGEFMDKVDVVNPLYDWVDAELVDLYITNLGGHAPSYLYRIVADHYRTEDIHLGAKEDP